MRDYELFPRSKSTMAEVFDCTTGQPIAYRVFRGLFHKWRAKVWAEGLI